MSSKNVYGKAEKLPIDEEQPLKPTDPYGASKAAADLICQSYSTAFELPITVIRSSGLFGPKSRLQQVIPIFIKQALSNSQITIEGDGSQSTDFNYVQNLVDAIISISESNIYGVYNVAYGKEYSIKEIADMILKKTNSKSSIKSLPWRSGEKGMKLSLSIDKARNDNNNAHNVPAPPISVALDMISRINFEPPNPIAPKSPISTDLLATLENVK